MKFTARHFDPAKAGGTSTTDGGIVFRAPATDRAPGAASTARVIENEVYIFSPRTVLAVNAALATGRPLLVSGEPGSGKTALARNVAAVLAWTFHAETVTSTTRATDLQWRFDALRRLNDAYSRRKHLLHEDDYVAPGVLWWAFNPESAIARVQARARANDLEVPEFDPAIRKREVVVLLDEIDKADPDVPNDLLEPFDANTFTVRETGQRIERDNRRVLLILTTNGEREMPPAFLRRCIRLALGIEDPSKEAEWFVDVADEHFGKSQHDLHLEIATQLVLLRDAADKAKLRKPGTAEFLDAIRVCRDLELERPSSAWRNVVQAVLWKHDVAAPASAA